MSQVGLWSAQTAHRLVNTMIQPGFLPCAFLNFHPGSASPDPHDLPREIPEALESFKTAAVLERVLMFPSPCPGFCSYQPVGIMKYWNCYQRVAARSWCWVSTSLGAKWANVPSLGANKASSVLIRKPKRSTCSKSHFIRLRIQLIPL